jgi:hypothetical protein
VRTLIQVGLLWLDDDPRRPLALKISQAAQRYAAKYGRAPDICYVHPSALNGSSVEAGPIRVLPAADLLPHHLWLGIAETPPFQEAPNRATAEPSPAPAARRSNRFSMNISPILDSAKMAPKDRAANT